MHILCGMCKGVQEEVRQSEFEHTLRNAMRILTRKACDRSNSAALATCEGWHAVIDMVSAAQRALAKGEAQTTGQEM